MKLHAQDRILVTGAGGMAGRALVAELRDRGFTDVIALKRRECDLLSRTATLNYFRNCRPRYVFHLAAKVGGIRANMADPVGFLQNNALINCHVLEAAHQAAADKTLVLGSSCIYPRECPQPMREEFLLTGPLEPTNEGYAIGKLVGLKLAKYYHDQYGMKTVCPVPSNIYGPGDSFDLEHSHVLSALVRRFVEAREARKSAVQLWGTGNARRELVHVHDVVRGMIFCMENLDGPEIHNLGPGTDFSIAELAALVARATCFEGRIEWDSSKPDGMPRKCMDVSKLADMGFRTEISLEQGVAEVVREFEGLSPRERK